MGAESWPATSVLLFLYRGKGSLSLLHSLEQVCLKAALSLQMPKRSTASPWTGSQGNSTGPAAILQPSVQGWAMAGVT